MPVLQILITLVLLIVVLGIVVAMFTPGVGITQGLTAILAICVVGLFNLLGIYPKSEKLKMVNEILNNDKQKEEESKDGSN